MDTRRPEPGRFQEIDLCLWEQEFSASAAPEQKLIAPVCFELADLESSGRGRLEGALFSFPPPVVNGKEAEREGGDHTEKDARVSHLSALPILMPFSQVSLVVVFMFSKL